MNNRYEWDEATIIKRRGLSLVARAWARFCPARTKLAFARDPIKHINRIKLWINMTIGAIAGPLVNLSSIIIMHLPWAWTMALLPAITWSAGTVYVLIGGANPTRKDIDDALAEMFPGDGRQSDNISAIASCMDRVWALEIMSQVAGVRNRARLEQHLMRHTVDDATNVQQTEPARRF